MASFFVIFLGTQEIGLTGSGTGVSDAGAGVNVNDVAEALPSADESVLLGIGPLDYGAINGMIDSGGDRFIISVFETEWSGIRS